MSANNGSMITTYQSVLHKFNGFIPHSFTQLPNYSRQWLVAEIWNPMKEYAALNSCEESLKWQGMK